MQVIRATAPLHSMERLLHAGAPSLVYDTTGYLRFLGRCAGGELGVLEARQGDEILGALPYFRNEHPELGAVVNSLPWFGSHGGCLLRPDATPEVCAALLGAFRQELADDPKLLSAAISLSPFRQEQADTYIQALGPDIVEPRIGQVLMLPRGLCGADDATLRQTVLGLARQKTRNLIRKALAQGFELREDDGDKAWDFLYDSHAGNMAAISGKPKLREHLQELRSTLEPGQRRLTLAMLGGRPVAAMLCLYHGTHVEYFIPTVLRDYRPQQPLTFLICEGLMHAMRAGCDVWNFGGSWKLQESLHHFKAGWGAVDMPYSVFIIEGRDARRRIRENLCNLRAWSPYYYFLSFALLEEPS